MCASSTLHWWICSAEHALEEHGVSRGLLSTGAADIVVQHESGANPHAYNGWDSNAAAGHPSEGIAQVIGPTFHAYALPGHHDIWNPVDNMIAAFRYAISRYGSMNNIPGVVAVGRAGLHGLLTRGSGVRPGPALAACSVRSRPPASWAASVRGGRQGHERARNVLSACRNAGCAAAHAAAGADSRTR